MTKPKLIPVMAIDGNLAGFISASQIGGYYVAYNSYYAFIGSATHKADAIKLVGTSTGKMVEARASVGRRTSG